MGQHFSAMADYSIFDKHKQSKSSHNGLPSFTDDPFSAMADCYRVFSKPKPSKSRDNRLLDSTTTTLALTTLATVAVSALVYYRTRFDDHLDDEIDKDHEDQEEEKRQVYPPVSDLLVVSKTPNMDFIFNEGDGRQQQQHKILLVGEGDFSFSASLASSSPSASNMVATSLNSRDATEMVKHDALSGMLFDRIIFNFPHAGFFEDDSTESQLRRNQMLVALFFENAKKMLKAGGEIHVTHKCSYFFQRWNIQVLASNVGLRLIEEVPFNFRDYPGYHTKYGFRVKCMVLLVSGHPLVIEPHPPSIDALVAAWLPATKGHGIAGVLSGDCCFTGKLPRTWFKTLDQLPMNVGDPLYPFSYGLTMNPIESN
ncbi:hypothetical protein FEM48_Zijuj02G0012600 [Ziziphus jujuba var. spinosa]|uniref:25S rRNA (uridine-N(3))-methyltransferase BMT5-like domain-containing protein n=1 Tax=Ziziphus jujuba var. spinosa TaxID=714518 RepID=A0A978VSR8_ZIZJJ|nr:hypothetical protein FEM48_Zijuj02G0012600 [Ziziphus jujuba var. spinosa]